MNSKIIISNSVNYSPYKSEDARLLALKNSALIEELKEANAEVYRLRRIVKTYQKRMDRAYSAAIIFQSKQIHPLCAFSAGIMTVLALTGLVLMII